MPTPEQVRAAVDAYVDAYRQNSKEALVELFAPDGVWHDPVGAPPHEGREAIAAFWDTAHSMAEKIVLEPKDIVVCGAEAAMVFTINAHVGDGGHEASTPSTRSWSATTARSPCSRPTGT